MNHITDVFLTSSVRVRSEVRLIHPAAQMPYRKRPTDAGYDIHSIQNISLPPNGPTIIRTGIQLSVPPGWYYSVEGRSSLWRKRIFPEARGIIDSTYCGELEVSLVNLNTTPYEILVGDRIAQIILHKQYDADFIRVDQFSSLYNCRGTEGFGSTGR